MILEKFYLKPASISGNNNKNSFFEFLSIVLVEPSKPQNLGSIARVMKNFGFTNLLLVNPLLNLADPEIQIVARHAGSIVHQAELIQSLEDVRKRFDVLIGTTARVGSDYNLNRVAISLGELTNTDFPLNDIALVFGREQHGLTNDEISLCDIIVSIPTHRSYPALNISHAAAIILHTISLKIRSLEQLNHDKRPKHRAASYNERQQLLNYFNRLIKTIGYHPEKQQVALQSFSNVLSRGYVTGRELTTLMGVLKWITINLGEKDNQM
jgi:TrmH family RNA methyltransferase